MAHYLKLHSEDPPCSDFSDFSVLEKFPPPWDSVESYLVLSGGFLELKLSALRSIAIAVAVSYTLSSITDFFCKK